MPKPDFKKASGSFYSSLAKVNSASNPNKSFAADKREPSSEGSCNGGKFDEDAKDLCSGRGSENADLDSHF